MSRGIPKGPEIKWKLKLWSDMSHRLTISFALRNLCPKEREKARLLVKRMKKEQDDVAYRFSLLPKRFDRNYGLCEYRQDVWNVIDHYTCWKSEDIYRAKKSLKRLRKYEQREGLAPWNFETQRKVIYESIA